MNITDMITKQQLIDKADESIQNLNQNIADINIVNSGLFAAVSDNIVTGTLGDAVKQHILDLVYLNSNFKNVLLMDIQDYNDLIRLLNEFITDPDDERLDGFAIQNGIDACNTNIQYAEDEIARLQNEFNQLNLAEQFFWGTWYYGYQELQCQREINTNRSQLDDYDRQKRLFDAIQVATDHLFSQNDELRIAVQTGYNEIINNWDGDTCSTAGNTSWRNDIGRINDEYIQRYADTYYSYDDDGNLIINYDEIDVVYRTDPNSLNPYQYAALNNMYDSASEEQLTELYDHANISEDPSIYQISPTFGVSLEFYHQEAEYEAYCCGYCFTQDHVEESNNLTRAELLLNTYYDIYYRSGGEPLSYTVSFSSDVSANGVVSEMTAEIRYDATTYGWATAPHPGTNTITQYSYEFYSISDAATDNSNTTMWDLAGTEDGVVLGAVDSIIQDRVGAVQGRIDMPSWIWIPAQVASEIGELDYNHGYVCNSVDVNTANTVMTATAAGGQLSVTRRDNDYGSYGLNPQYGQGVDYRNVHQISNVNINESVLMDRIDVYNQETGSNISYADLSNGLQRFMNGEIDCDLINGNTPSDDPFVNYVRWWKDFGEQTMHAQGYPGY